MSTNYLVVGTKAQVHSFIHRLFLRRLCVPIGATVLNAYAIAKLYSPDVVRVMSQFDRSLLVLLLSALAGTLAHLWTYALGTLALHHAVVEIPTAEPIEPTTEKGESACSPT